MSRQSRAFGTVSLLALTVAAGSAPVWAQEDTAMDQLMVWGTEVRSSSISLGEQDIALKQADHVSDLLRTIPGVDVGGAHSLNQRITIRSMDDKDLRIQIDGANQNTYMYHHMGNLQIHADILKSADIAVGKNSVVNGGLGGAVRFETKEAKDLLRPGQRFGGRAQIAYADNNSTSYSGTLYGQVTPKFDVLAYYNFVDRGNYDVGGGKILDDAGKEIPGTDGRVRGLKGELGDALVKLGYDIASNQRIELGYERYDDEGNYSYRPDMGLATDLAIAENLGLPLVYPTEFTRDTFTANYELVWGNGSILKAAAFHNTSTLWRDESGVAAVFPGSAMLIEGEAENTGANILATSPFDGGHELTYGAEVIHYDTAYSEEGVRQSGEDATNVALFIEDAVSLGEILTVTPGLRYDSYTINSAVVDDKFEKITFALGAELALGDSVLVRVGTAQLFKGPEIGEVFTGAGLGDVPNPDIESEKGWNTEVAMGFEDDVLGADAFRFGATVFHTSIADYIYDYASNPDGGYWKDNVGDMTIEGVEAYIGYDLGNFTSLVTYSTSDSELDSFAAYAALGEARLDRQQGDTFSVTLGYDIPSADLELQYEGLIVGSVAAGPDLDGATLDNAKDGYHVHNISVRWTPRQVEGLQLTFGIDNLFDEFYASQSSRTGVSFHPRFGRLYLQDYEPGRNVKLTGSYQF